MPDNEGQLGGVLEGPDPGQQNKEDVGEQGVAKITAPKEEREGWVELKGGEKLQSKGIVETMHSDLSG